MTALYRAVLRLFLPAAFRAEAGAEMLEVFEDGLAAARRRGMLAVALFTGRAVLDAVVAGAAERRSPPVEARSWRQGLRLDIRAAVRDASRRPGAAFLSIGTLALGIAATVLIGVLVRDVLLAPLPFADPDGLVRLLERTEEGATFWPSLPNVVDWREQARVFDGVAAADIGTVKPVLIGNDARRVTTGSVSQGFFELLGIRPVAGRGFRPEEGVAGAAAVVLIGEELWSALGRPPLEDLVLRIDRETAPVIGVVPAGFRFLGHGNGWLQADVWTALERNGPQERRSHGYHTVARLAPGTDLASARAAMAQLATRLAATYGDDTDAQTVVVEPLASAVLGRTRDPLTLLGAGAIVVLLVSVLNLGAGLLARGIAGAPGLAVRTALGARRADLIRLQLIHASVLAGPGAILGGGLAWLGLQVIRSLSAGAVPRLDQAGIDPLAVAGAVGIAWLAALAAGVLPALTLSRTAGLSARVRTRGSTRGKHHNLMWDLFVAGQIALTMGLLVAAGLLVRSMIAALDMDLGYEPAGVVIAPIALPESRYLEPDRRVAYFEALLDRLRADPAIAAAGMVSTPPDETFAYIAPARRDVGEASFWSGFRLADPDYFQTLRIPVETGSLDPASDAVVIDRQLADALWKAESPLGTRVASAMTDGLLPVSGVVGGIREWQQEDGGLGAIYMHYRRRPDALLTMNVLARGPSPQATIRAFRAAASATDPLVPIDVDLLGDRIARSMADRRLMLGIAGGFALIALLLAAAGVHSLITQAAARRRRETGIRMILGESGGSIRRRMLGAGLRAAVFGVSAGAIVAWMAGRALRSQLFGITAGDPAGLGGAAALLLVTAGLAAWLPARRAVRTDPAALLRDE